MKYMLLINSAGTEEAEQACEASAEDWMAYDKAVREAGIYVDAHSLADLTTATTVRVTAGGERVVTDGPFAETREHIGGYDIIECRDLDEAIEVASKHPMARFGRIEVRPTWPWDRELA